MRFPSRVYASVNLDAVEHNFDMMRRQTGDVPYCAVIKTDGYGHGAAAIAGRGAAVGGAGVLFACDRPGRDRAWTCALLGIVSFFGLCLLLHGAGIVPFAPWVTATQKVLIVSFALWTADLARRHRAAPLRRRHKVALVALMALATAVLATGTTGIAPVATSPAPRSEQCSCATGTTVIPLARDVWAYSMSRNYWGRKPWAPDPCFRENVMYTGHLLQLLALYETFTGDARYWKEGFEFVWDARKRVRYDVRKLIDVTVFQMRNGPNGGVTCEPGLMFFPCNNHPHVALALFARLGHGDWTKDARRWEKWALAHYAKPLLGGGALNLVYHVRSGIFYPMGNGGLDGWSLLWYEPWATDRNSALALWREAARKIDWKELDEKPDASTEEFSCCNPVDIPPVVTASFMAAAARACDDPATAARLEKVADRFLTRRDGYYFLDAGREWRVGATANRIISLAEANGTRFRALVK